MTRPLPRVAIEAPVRGVKAMKIDLDGLQSDDRMVLRAEPDNPSDPCAVQVWAQEAPESLRLIGYLPRDLAARMHHEVDLWVGRIEKVLWREQAPAGVRLLLYPHLLAEAER